RKPERFTAEGAEDAQRTPRMILNVIPAKAGIHPSSDRATDKWVPAFAGTTVLFGRVLRATTASSAVKLCFLALALASAVPAWAACTGPVADQGARVRLAAAGPEGGVGLTFLGHASFLIESPQGV